jgi:hypothetical protein
MLAVTEGRTNKPVYSDDQRTENETWSELCNNMFDNYNLDNDRDKHLDIALSVNIVSQYL